MDPSGSYSPPDKGVQPEISFTATGSREAQKMAYDRRLEELAQHRKLAGPTTLDVILQTHSLGNSQSGMPRYCRAPKAEVLRRCLGSLVRSLAAAAPEVDSRLIVLDDHSEETSLRHIREELLPLGSRAELVSLETRGVSASILSCYRWGLERSRQGLVYFAQDDYLHEPGAIREMVGAYHLFRFFLGEREVGIHPFDDPYRYYAPGNIELTRLVHGPSRHWRQNYFTPSTFMVPHRTIREHWDLFEAMGTAPIGPTMEDDTINRLWRERGIFLFTPIPSLALHLQFETERDPFIRWQDLWESARPARSDG